jgi:hypothetical protein
VRPARTYPACARRGAWKGALFPSCCFQREPRAKREEFREASERACRACRPHISPACAARRFGLRQISCFFLPSVRVSFILVFVPRSVLFSAFIRLLVVCQARQRYSAMDAKACRASCRYGAQRELLLFLDSVSSESRPRPAPFRSMHYIIPTGMFLGSARGAG